MFCSFHFIYSIVPEFRTYFLVPNDPFSVKKQSEHLGWFIPFENVSI